MNHTQPKKELSADAIAIGNNGLLAQKEKDCFGFTSTVIYRQAQTDHNCFHPDSFVFWPYAEIEECWPNGVWLQRKGENRSIRFDTYDAAIRALELDGQDVPNFEAETRAENGW